MLGSMPKMFAAKECLVHSGVLESTCEQMVVFSALGKLECVRHSHKGALGKLECVRHSHKGGVYFSKFI